MVKVQREKRKVSSLFLTFLFGMLLLTSVVFMRTAEVSAAAMPANIPARVEVTSIKMTSPGRIVLKWKPAENATHYRIYRKDNGKWTGIVTIPAATQYVHDSSAQFPVTYGQKYIYTVRAYNTKSRVWSTYDPAGYTVYTNPDTPKLKGISANGKAVTISWEKAVGATNYYVYYKTETGNWIKCGKTDPNVLTYTHKNSTKYPLESGEKYYYTVRAYNAYLKGYSWIRYTSPAVKMPLAVPKLSGVRMIGDSVLFSWEEIKGASNYFVYSKLPGGNWKRIATLDGADNSCFIHKKSSSFPMIPGDTYIYTVRGYDEETGVSGPYDKNGLTYKIPVKQTVPTAQGKNTIRNFLLTGLQPVGSTMYMLGGGWDFSGSKHGSGIDSRTIGVSPLWEKFALQQTAKYNYRNHEYETRNGLDCAGYLGWTVYNTLHTTSGGPGYVMWSQSYGDNFRGRGWGYCRSIYGIKDYKAGDIMYNSEHVYIVVGQCSDGSVVLLHASPPGVMISGTYTKNWKSDSEAVRLAEYYMKKYYPAWYQKYPNVARGTYFLTDYSQFRWYVDGKGVLTDPDGYTEKSAAQILADLFR